MGRVRAVSEFDALAVATRGGATIRIRDIGHTEDGTYEQRSLARLEQLAGDLLRAADETEAARQARITSFSRSSMESDSALQNETMSAPSTYSMTK